jgi:hypothetical protein
MSNDRKQLTVWVSESQKQEWDDYQSELGFSSRGEMIRRAVEYYHAAETGDSGGDASEKVLSRLDDIEDRIERLKMDITDVRDNQMSEETLDELVEEFIMLVQTDRGPGTIEIPQEVWDENYGERGPDEGE